MREYELFGLNKSQTTTTTMNTEKHINRRRHVVILGSGFAGIEVLKRLQKKFRNNKNIDIILVSRDNFLLFTPMLPEVSIGMIETRHIVTPVRSFINKARFYEANVESIDLNDKRVVITHPIGRQFQPIAWDTHTLEYDYLVIALGSETNFFGMDDIKKNSFTMKGIDDAIILRNHVLNILEQASIEQDNKDLRKSLLTFVVVGGGFNGIETVGALNDFVRETIREFYKDIYMTDVRIMLVNSEDRILEQVDEDLGKWALLKLKDNGVEFIMNTQVTGATPTTAKLDNGNIINTHTIVWSTGVTPSKLIANLPCEHDKGHRIISNSYLEIPGYPRVYALGDCASVIDPNTGKPYPPTAQHAIRQGNVAAKNIISAIKGKEVIGEGGGENDKKNKKKKFVYKTKGMMAEIGKRSGVATLFGFKIHGFAAWWLWRTFYLANLPTTQKKLKVMLDWTMDLLFKPDVAMIKRFVNEKEKENENNENLKEYNNLRKDNKDSIKEIRS
ncbi:MAG TPA: NAD(P)/FAD-dependent oxidoreductase [Nitrososphaeraceae archaeon]|nr:NAD(P)/FAD-dependent oxidoreductase [Nitrososphaeraceae archaeon]